MKRILKVLLPSIFLLVFGISMIIVVSSCKKDDGSQCSVCADSSQCNPGLSCYTMSNGEVPRCLAKQGDTCSY